MALPTRPNSHARHLLQPCRVYARIHLSREAVRMVAPFVEYASDVMGCVLHILKALRSPLGCKIGRRVLAFHSLTT